LNAAVGAPLRAPGFLREVRRFALRGMLQSRIVARQKTVVTIISKISERPVDRQACLVVLAGMEIAKKYDLDRPEIIIGRSSKADIQVDQESVSRSHAKIACGEEIVIRDLGSTNGTWVNDRQVEEHALRDGDLVKIGRTIFKFLSGANIEASYHEEIYRLTTVDGLTQVFNKRYFLESLEREISRCRRYDRGLSLVLYDADHFKKINDTFGHLAGDYVLKALADTVKDRIRREDVLARFGGEEFAVILPEIDLKGAQAFAEKIRRLIEESAFRFEDAEIPVTVSMGVATLDGTIGCADDFIKVADERLYEAKRRGRNRVVADEAA
jgi:two-component system, cell cycle response regulator